MVPGIMKENIAVKALNKHSPELPVRLLGKTGIKTPLLSMVTPFMVSTAAVISVPG